MPCQAYPFMQRPAPARQISSMAHAWDSTSWIIPYSPGLLTYSFWGWWASWDLMSFSRLFPRYNRRSPNEKVYRRWFLDLNINNSRAAINRPRFRSGRAGLSYVRFSSRHLEDKFRFNPG